MKHKISVAILLVALSVPVFLQAQYTKPVYISLPGPGNIQHLAYVVGKEKKFYEEMGIANAQIVVLRGNAINVQALVSGTVHFSSAFGPAMQTMFRGEQLRILVQIFNQVPFGLITRPEIKRLEDLKGAKIAVTFGGSTYSLLVALFAKHGLPQNFAEYISIPDNPGKILALQQGRVVAATEDAKGAPRLHLKTSLRVEGHTWLAARCGRPGAGALHHHDEWQRGVFAHTSPIYVAVDGEWWLFDQDAAQYMLTLIDGGLAYIRQTAHHHPPGAVTHHHGQEDHLAYLERPFHEARAAIQRRSSQG